MPEKKIPFRKKNPDSSHYLPHVARGAAINFFGIISRTVFVYIYTFILARMLPVDELGEFFLIFTIINLVGLAALVGLDLGVVRYVSLYAGERKFNLVRRSVRAGVFFGLPVGIAAALVLYLAAPLLSQNFIDASSSATSGLRIFALAVPFMVIARILNATTQGMHQMKYQVYSRDMGEQVFKTVLSLLVLALGAGLIGVVWANVTAVALAAGMSLLFAFMVLPREVSSSESPSLASVDDEGRQESPARQLLSYSLPLVLANVMVALWLQIDILLLGFLGTPSEVGYYGVAMKLALFISKSILAFVTVFTPIIADLWNKGNTEELKELYITISRWIFSVSFPVFLSIVLFSDSLLGIFGSGFEVGGGALIILAGGQLISAATGAAGMMVLMSGRSRMELINVTIALAVNVALCFILIPAYGVIGAAIAHMSAIFIVNIIRIAEIMFFMRMFVYDLSFFKPFLAGLAAAAAIFLIDRYMPGNISIFRIALLSSLLLVIYVLAIVVLGLSEQEKILLNKIRASMARYRTA